MSSAKPLVLSSIEALWVYFLLTSFLKLEDAIAYMMRCTTKYRLPETTRHAHKLASGPAIDTAPVSQEPPQSEQMSLF